MDIRALILVIVSLDDEIVRNWSWPSAGMRPGRSLTISCAVQCSTCDEMTYMHESTHEIVPNVRY